MTTISSSLSSVLQSIFSKADSNGDGELTQTELNTVTNDIQQVTGTKENAAQLMKQWDTDGDGQLSETELTNGGQLASAVQQALLKAQEMTSGGAFAAMLDGSNSSSNDVFGLLGGNSSSGSSSDSLASILGGSSSSSSGTDTISSMLEQIIARYQQQAANVGTGTTNTTNTDSSGNTTTQSTDTTA